MWGGERNGDGLEEHQPFREHEVPADSLGVALRQENQLQISQGEERTKCRGKNNCQMIKCEWL